MAIPQDIRDVINEFIVTNGNNEITAIVLNPILISIIDYIDAEVGDRDNLTLYASNLVSAINLVEENGNVLKLHAGTNDPNIVPPASYSVGDFYNQTSSGTTIAFYQYNGSNWILIE